MHMLSPFWVKSSIIIFILFRWFLNVQTFYQFTYLVWCQKIYILYVLRMRLERTGSMISPSGLAIRLFGEDAEKDMLGSGFSSSSILLQQRPTPLSISSEHDDEVF
ncbi:hypothetical protein F5880DRAFT_1098943 [Lentinula raphanica]|nr:hypothetical protein F5880DRAFT_1098943 [Lentinula raphanica]